MAAERVVIVGGGLTAARAAESLREHGFDGDVVVVTAENRVPYERPPLSKGYLTGSDAASATVPLDARWYRDHGVDLRRGVRAVSLDSSRRTVSIVDTADASGTAGAAAASTGAPAATAGDPATSPSDPAASSSARVDELAYDRLLLATGASPRRYAGPGARLRGVHHLRTLSDSTSLRRALRDGGRRVVIVGAGWIGLEAAAAARGYGNDVTVLGRDDVPLASAIGPELGAVFARMHEQQGVDLRMRTAVTSLRGEHGRVVAAVLGTGEEVPANLVLFGIGAVPNVELAASAGLEVNNGIVTDAGFATSAEGVYAAGDVASTYNPTLGHHLRVEHWANADAGGRAAGKVLAGERVEYDEIPYFYTDQYDLGMEYSGYGELAADADLVVRGDRDGREFVALWLAGGRVVAGMNVNVWDVNEHVQRLIRSRAVVDRERLLDTAVPLEALAGATA